MRKQKWFILAAVLLLVSVVAGVHSAKADVNIMENGSVYYAWINDPNDLRDVINSNGAYSNVDILGKSEYSNTYRIIVDEPGTLVFAPLCTNSNLSLELYSDFNLISSIGKMSTIQSSREKLLALQVDAGTYYYRLYNRLSSSLKVTVFIGFVPDSKVMPENPIVIQEVSTCPEVNIIPVSSSDELASYMDNDGIPSSSDKVEKNGEGVMPTYQFTVSEPGTLMISSVASALTNPQYVHLYLFSNQDLSSRIAEIDCVKSSQSGMTAIEVQPGTYYYYCDRWNGRDATQINSYIGFISENDNGRQDRYAKEEYRPGDLEVPHVWNSDEFIQSIADQQFVISEDINKGERGNIHRFTLNEPALVYVYLFCNGNNYYGYIFSDEALTSQITRIESYNSSSKNQTISLLLLDAGEYYYYTYHWNYSNKASVYSYMAYTPVSDIISVDGITLSDDLSSAIVKFNIAEEYNPDQYRAQVRVEKGVVRARSVGNTDIWKDETRENAIESHEFVATENGFYTARISGNELQPFLLTFEVTGIGGEGAVPETERVASEDNTATEASEAEESQTAESQTEESAEEPRAEMTASEMRQYIRMLEDMIDDQSLTMPEITATTTQEEYMKMLEQTLRDNGYDF